MKPFRVDWKLSHPVCLSEDRLHLDALLAWASVQQALRAGAPSADALACQEQLPLARYEHDNHWIWKASSLLFTFASPPFLVPCIRRTDIETMAFAVKQQLIHTKKSQVSQGTGPYKNFDLRFSVQWVDSVTAYGIGDIEAVSRFLSTVSALGKLTRIGWGKIAEFSVIEDFNAEELWQQRSLPIWVKLLNNERHCEGAESTVRPPYWRRENKEPVWEFIG
jgi:CRISPR type IV-associated protein Csf3